MPDSTHPATDTKAAAAEENRKTITASRAALKSCMQRLGWSPEMSMVASVVNGEDEGNGKVVNGQLVMDYEKISDDTVEFLVDELKSMGVLQ